MNTNDKSILQTILTLLDVLSSHKTEGQSWIHLLSLLCIFTILNQPTASASASAALPANPLQKLLGDLTKGMGTTGNAGGADTLLSLLPLLNNPQIKSKLNPGSITAMMNLVQNLTGTPSSSAAKPSAPPPVSDTHASSIPPASPAPAAPPTPPIPNPSPAPTAPPKAEISTGGRYLDWKSSF